MKRRKTALEKWFSWSRHRRRLGVGAIAAQQADEDWLQLAAQTVQGAPGQAAQYAHGGTDDLAQHLQRVRAEFIGQSELLYRHAELIVLLRREADTEASYARFERMWQAQTDFLCTHLDLRWLVAACDSFIDHAKNPTLRALAMGAVLLVNTVKLQETERFLAGPGPGPGARAADRPEALQELHTHRVGLFDGLTAFIAGTDDTLRNMRWRLQDVAALHPLGAIVLEIFERLQRDGNDNVYLRFKQRHQREKTRWW